MQEPESPTGSIRPPDDPNRAGVPARRPPIAFLDRRGVAWRVAERDTRRDPGCLADRCLVFSNENVVRRVWRYPHHWQDLSDAEFDELNSVRPLLPLPRAGTA